MDDLYRAILIKPAQERIHELSERIERAGALWAAHVDTCADCRASDWDPDPEIVCSCAVCEMAVALGEYRGCRQ
jgi:hypothetical protein